jgi:hypothetical protein
MIASPEEIRELLSTVREILREHRRMALYAQMLASHGAKGADLTLAVFDVEFPKEPS